MRSFWCGVVAGLGGGLLAGWWLGAPAALPRSGLAEWAVGFVGLALICAGGAAATGRGRPAPPAGPSADPPAAPGPPAPR
jgi:hypothetical protein